MTTPNSSGGGAALETMAWMVPDGMSSMTPDERDEMSRGGDPEDYGYADRHDVALVRRTDAESAIRTLEERVASLEADAERYRWLRDKSVPPHNFYISVPIEFDGVRYTAAEVDAGIDSARAALSKTAQPGIE